MFSTLDSLAQNYGIPIAILVFFIWRDWKREQSMTRSINTLTEKLFDKTTALEKEMREVLKSLVEKTTTALVDNTNAMREIITAVNKIPCFKCERKDKE